MSYLRGFIPWIVAGVVSSFDWRWGAVAGLLSGILLLLQDRRAGVTADAQILDVSTVVYFAALGVLALAAPHSPLEHYDDVLSFGWLALTAWTTLAIRRPFTLGIAKRQTPREYWDLPEFVQINVIITAVWATAFTLIGIGLAVCAATDAAVLVGIAVHVVGLAAPIAFTSIYPARAQARAQAHLAAAASNL
jgi:hypothetical protein